MEFQNAVKKRSTDWQSRATIPSKDELRELRPGGYVRLQAEGGSFLWARIMRVRGRELELVSDDSLPGGDLRRGEEVVCSVGCIFSIV